MYPPTPPRSRTTRNGPCRRPILEAVLDPDAFLPRECSGRSCLKNGREKAARLLVVGADRVAQRGQLGDDGEHQPGFCPGDGGICPKLGLLGRRQDLLSGLVMPRVPVTLEQGSEVLQVSRLEMLRGRVGLEESEGHRLVQFGEQLQRQGVVLLQACGELVYEPGLLLNESQLIPCEQFKFLDDGIVGLKAAEPVDFVKAMSGEDHRVDGVGLGARHLAVAVHRLGVHGVHRKPRFEQGVDQDAVARLDDAGDLVGLGDAL